MQIEKRFLEKLSSQLRIVPVKLGGRSRLQHQGSKPVASVSTALGPTQRRELEPATGELTSGWNTFAYHSNKYVHVHVLVCVL